MVLISNSLDSLIFSLIDTLVLNQMDVGLHQEFLAYLDRFLVFPYLFFKLLCSLNYVNGLDLIYILFDVRNLWLET